MVKGVIVYECVCAVASAVVNVVEIVDDAFIVNCNRIMKYAIRMISISVCKCSTCVT